MNARANTRVSILRGTATDTYGDTVDTLTAARTGVVASLIEVTRRPYLPAEGATRVVRSHVCRLTSGTDVVKTDRILDEADNSVYNILELNASPGSPAHRPDIVLSLSRTN